MTDKLNLEWDNLDYNLKDDNSVANSEHSLTRIVVESLLYGLVALIAVAGNILVIWTVCARKPMKLAVNYLIVNIAIADIFMAIVFGPLTLLIMMQSNWIINNFTCKIFDIVWSVTQSVTICSFLFVSIIWFKLIVCPSQKSLTKCEGVLISIGIWVVSIFIAIPNWIYSRAEQYDLEPPYCATDWPMNRNPYMEAFYVIFYTIWTYFFPALWLICTYIIISDKLFRSYNLVGLSYDDEDSLKHNKQSVKMMIVASLVHLLSLSPITLMRVGSKFIDRLHITVITLEILVWIAFTATMWSPIIYLAMNDKFRRNVKETFRWFPCITTDDH